MEELVNLLKKKKLTISCAESLTGGLFASSLTDIPGVSSVFKGGVVTYCNDAKTDVLGVPHHIINSYGAVSQECALEMASRCRFLFRSDVAVSFTGNAGPDVMEGKPAGLVYIGVALQNITLTYECHFSGTRNEVRKACIEEARKKIMSLI